MAATRRLSELLLPSMIIRKVGRCLKAIRNHSTAAAVQPMCDFEDEWFDNERKKKSEAVMDSDGVVSGRRVRWAVIGEPGANKHVYAYGLSKLLGVPYISIASLVRQELSPRSSLYKKISNALNQGRHLPEDVLLGLLSNTLIKGHYRGESGFILDGLPQNRFQAELLDEIAEIDLVICFKCIDKLAGSSLATPTLVGYTGSEKLRKYSAQVEELGDYYKKQNKLLSFQVAGTPAETWQGLISALSLKHMNAAHSQTVCSPASPKLTV